MPAVGASQRPVLARNDPLDVLSDQRQQSFPVAAADGGKKSPSRFECSSRYSLNVSISRLWYPSIELHQVLEDQVSQLFPRAWTSVPPSDSPPSLIGAKPRFSANAPISSEAASSSLARNTTLLPPCTAGSWASGLIACLRKPFAPSDDDVPGGVEIISLAPSCFWTRLGFGNQRRHQ